MSTTEAAAVSYNRVGVRSFAFDGGFGNDTDRANSIAGCGARTCPARLDPCNILR